MSLLCVCPLCGLGRLVAVLAFLAVGSGVWAAAASAGPSPQRVVTLDWGVAETLVALGVPPVGVPDTAGYADWVAEPPLPPETVNLGSRFEPNLELIRSLSPDLIVLIPFQASLEPLLRRIAPTLILSVHEGQPHPYDAATEATRTLARHLGREAAAEALIARTEALLAAARARRPDPGGPLLVAAVADAHHLWVFGQGSLYGDVLDRMGVRNAWTEPVSGWGFSAIGADRLAGVDAAAFVTLRPLPPDFETGLTDSPVWKALPFVQQGRVVVLPPVLMFGMLPASGRFATLLSEALAAP